MKKNISDSVIWFVVLLAFIVAAHTVFDSDDEKVSTAQAFEIDEKLISHSLLGEIKIEGTPTRIAVMSDDMILVGAKEALLKYDSSGKLLFTENVDSPVTAIATSDKSGNIFVAHKDFISIYSRDLKKISTWKQKFSHITSIAVSHKQIYVADAGKRAIYACDFDGNILRTFAHTGKDRLEVPSPYLDMFVDDKKSLWVVNPGKHLVQNYDDKGTVISSWGIGGTKLDEFRGCCNPSHIARMPNGNIVTSEKGIALIKIYSPEGKFISAVTGDFKNQKETLDVAVDSNSRILLLDSKNKRVCIYARR